MFPFSPTCVACSSNGGGSGICATSNVCYLDIGELFNVYNCFKMQISNKGCGVIISLLNGLFWYNSAFALFPACILPKKRGLTSAVVPVSCAPPCSHSLGAADLQRTYFAFWNENYLFGYVILKDPISLGVYCAPFGTEVWARGKLVWMLLQAGAAPGWCVAVQSLCVTSGDLLDAGAVPNRSAVSMAHTCSGPSCVLPRHGVNLVTLRLVLKLVYWRLSKIQSYAVYVHTALAA